MHIKKFELMIYLEVVICMHEIKDRNNLLAIIIDGKYHAPGISFFTPDDLSQQVAYMNHPKGHEILPHVHNKVTREVHYTQEVLIIKTGKLRVDFYTNEKEYIESRVLSSGDIIVLVSGGHGFTVLENVEMYEIKQGPYTGEGDKTRFKGISSGNLQVLG